MEEIVPWKRLHGLIEPFYPKPGKGRRPVGLERHELCGQLLREVKEYLTTRGLKVSRGTIVDATIIHAPSSTKNEATARS